MSLLNKIEYLISLPKSFYVSWRLTSFKLALHLPIVVRFNTVLKNLSGKLEFGSRPYTGMVKIGFGEVGIYDKRYQRSILEISGKVICKGKTTIGHGGRICVMDKGILEFGNNFSNTAQMTIICKKNIIFDDDVLTSWETLIMDTDFHYSVNIETNQHSIAEKPIYIGKNVWIGTKAVILKGSHIANGCIIGADALVTRKFEECNCVIAGNPATIVKKNHTLKR